MRGIEFGSRNVIKLWEKCSIKCKHRIHVNFSSFPPPPSHLFLSFFRFLTVYITDDIETKKDWVMWGGATSGFSFSSGEIFRTEYSLVFFFSFTGENTKLTTDWNYFSVFSNEQFRGLVFSSVTKGEQSHIMFFVCSSVCSSGSL